MSGPIVSISHFMGKEGKSEDLLQLNEEVAAQLKNGQTWNCWVSPFMNQAVTELSIVHIFPDAESFDRHLEGAIDRSNTSLGFIEPIGQELYGTSSDQVIAMLTPPVEPVT